MICYHHAKSNQKVYMHSSNIEVTQNLVTAYIGDRVALVTTAMNEASWDIFSWLI